MLAFILAIGTAWSEPVQQGIGCRPGSRAALTGGHVSGVRARLFKCGFPSRPCLIALLGTRVRNLVSIESICLSFLCVFLF